MNQDITFHRILDILENFQKNSPMLNTFAYGNLIDFGQQHISGGTVNYPFLFAVPQSIEFQENITTYQFNLIFADILNVSLDNEKDIISNMSLEVRRFLSFVKYGINTYPELFNNIDITLPTIGYPFWERFSDHVGGIALDCNITVFEPLDACDWFPTPTASPNPTSTPTSTPAAEPTSTPTNTPTTTPTPSTSEDFYYNIRAVSNCSTGDVSGDSYVARSSSSLPIGTYVIVNTLFTPFCAWKIESVGIGPEDDVINSNCGISLPVSCCC